MRRSFKFTMLSLCLNCLVVSGTSLGEMRQIQTARLHAQVHVDATRAVVWSYATRGKNFENWMTMWNRPRNAGINLVRVGDWLQFVDEWNNRGRSVVTYLSRNKEIRLANDPDDGSFMCQIKMTLDSEGGGTIVHLDEQYTDESASTDFKATAQKVQAAMDRALRSLKGEVERKKGS
jgi:uncharacterized protein YndB with AHSA1/START domain